MTDTESDVLQRLNTVEELDSVMTAMRGIAASHLNDANRLIESVHAYADTIALAIGQVIALLPEEDSMEVLETASSGELLIVLCSEQGFVGAFNERILNKAVHELTSDNTPDLLLVGNRGFSLALSMGIRLRDSIPMATRAKAVPALAVRLTDILFQWIGEGSYDQITLIHPHFLHSGNLTLTRRSIVPIDFSRFPVIKKSLPPLLTMSPERLIQKLTEEYVYAELCDALVMTHAAENDARLQAMVRARSNVAQIREDLTTEYQQQRHEQITSEIAELAIGRHAHHR